MPRRRVAWLFGFMAVLIVAQGLYEHRSALSLEEGIEAQRQARDVQDALTDILAALLDAETGQRGYMLTGDRRYLEPYTAAVGQIQPRIHALTSLDVVLSDRGRQLMNELRVAVAGMRDHEAVRLHDRAEAARGAGIRATMTVMAWVPFSWLLLTAFGTLLLRSERVPAAAGPAVVGHRAWIALRFGFAAAVVGIASGARWILIREFGQLPPFITFYPAVLLAAMVAGGGPGILATAMSALVADYYFLPPTASFALHSPADWVALSLFTCTNVALCVLSERLRLARLAEAVEGERRAAMERLGLLNIELQQRVQARTVELEERESLIREIHHRVKNNMQVISSLINLQIRSLPDASSRAALLECRSRVQTMALIHEMLYAARDYARVAFSDYAKALAGRIFGASGVEQPTVTLELTLEPVLLPVDQAIPCGLILNELITNALKHAFPDGRGGAVRVGLHPRANGRVELSVADDGVGLGAQPEAQNAGSLGMELVATLVRQLNGRLEVVRQPGTTVVINFPARQAAPEQALTA